MAQRQSGYDRKQLDAYETPPWVTAALLAKLRDVNLWPRGLVWEPCAGSGKMVRALRAEHLEVWASDLAWHAGLDAEGDFTAVTAMVPPGCRAIITNPPYGLVDESVRRAAELMRARDGLVAMLLKVDWCSAKTRADLFEGEPGYAMKLTLRDRITWFDPEPGKAGPSENHAWFVWDWRPRGIFSRRREPLMRWADMPDDERNRLRELRARNAKIVKAGARGAVRGAQEQAAAASPDLQPRSPAGVELQPRAAAGSPKASRSAPPKTRLGDTVGDWATMTKWEGV